MGIATHALGYNFHLSGTEKLGYNHIKRWAIATLTRQLIHMYSLEKLAMETLSEQNKVLFPLFAVSAPFIQEAARQYLLIEQYKVRVTILTNSKETADLLVEHALTYARQTLVPNERAFTSLMDDVLIRLARGDSVADVTEWVLSNIH